MRLQPTAMFVIFIGTTRCYRTGPAGWPCPHISNCYHGELSPYSLNAPVVILSLAVLLILSNPNQRRISAYLHRLVVLLTLAVSGEFLPAFVSSESRSSRDSSHFQFSVTFPVSQLAHRIKRGRRLHRDLCISTGILISRYLDLCQGFTGELSPHSLSHQC